MDAEQETVGLTLRMMEGDSQAFDRLTEYYYPRTPRVVYFMSGSHADSEDIIQGTFVLCWMNRKKIKELKYFRSWLCKTLTREAWRYCRRNRKEQPMGEVFGKEEPETASVLKEVMICPREEELYKAIRDPPVKQRTVVVLYYSNQMSIRGIVGIIGCLEGTAKSRLLTARTNLKQESMKESREVRGEVAL